MSGKQQIFTNNQRTRYSTLSFKVLSIT